LLKAPPNFSANQNQNSKLFAACSASMHLLLAIKATATAWDKILKSIPRPTLSDLVSPSSILESSAPPLINSAAAFGAELVNRSLWILFTTNRCRREARLSSHEQHHQDAHSEICHHEHCHYHRICHRNPRPIWSIISWTLCKITILEVALVSALRNSASCSSSRVRPSKSLSAIVKPSLFSELPARSGSLFRGPRFLSRPLILRHEASTTRLNF
jgi:hypothetical protein